MKKPICLLLIIIFGSFCGPKQDKVDRINEEGVEVVINHLEPYKIKGEPTNLLLEEVFSVDTNNLKMLRIGLTDIETFDIDSEGNVFIIQWQASENYIYKFDNTGNFIKSFLRKGQGPGEIEWGGTLLIDSGNRIIAKDPSKPELLLYDYEGNFIKERHLGGRIGIEAHLDNGGYLISWQEMTPEFFLNHIGMCDSNFLNIKIISSRKAPNPITAEEIKVGGGKLYWTASKDSIYIGNSEDGYEICIYDLDGKLFRKIRKKYKPVKIQKEDKDAVFRRMGRSPDRDKYYFADHWSPFRYCFADDEGRLFVMTYEKGTNLGEAIYDIFNSEGAFIARASLGNLGEVFTFPVKARKDHIYCLKEDNDGYKELVVYKMRWE